MKKVFLSFLLLLISVMMFQITASAHSYLKSSYPEQTSTVNEEVQELQLNFEGGIEATSKVEIYDSNGGLVAIDEVIVVSPTITVHLNEPLVTDDYEVNWYIIGEDGHGTDGQYSFTIVKPEKVAEEAVEELKEEQNPVVEDNSKDREVSNESGNFFLIMIPFVIISVVVGTFFIYRKKG